MTNVLRSTLCALLALSLALPAIVSAEEAPGPLSEIWMMVPKEGSREAFFEAFGEHMKYRQENGDPWTWRVYTPVLGDDLDRVAVRACCFNWADVDSYREWGMANKHVNEHYVKNVADHVDTEAHYFDEIAWGHSHWERGHYKLISETSFMVKPENMRQFMQARDKMSQIALDHGWDTDENVWLWTSQIGGKPVQSIVVPYKNYADMQRDTEDFFNFLARTMKSEERAAELLEAFSSSVYSQEYQIWEHHPDMSMKDED